MKKRPINTVIRNPVLIKWLEVFKHYNQNTFQGFLKNVDKSVQDKVISAKLFR